MHGESKLKSPGEKLISIKLTYWDRIDDIQILGDFFIHPEESLALLEDSVKGMGAGSSEAEFAGAIRLAADRNSISMIGISPESIAKAIRMAMS